MSRYQVALLLFTFTIRLFADPVDLLSFQNKLQSYGARLEGSKEERLAFDEVAERLKALGIIYERRTLDKSRRGHSFSEVIEATIPGESSERYILASPMEGGAFSTALLLEIAEKLIISLPQHTVTLFFLGGERGDTSYHPYGSRHAVETIQPDTGTFVIYLDAETTPKTWEIKIGGNGIVAPLWLTKNLVDTLISELIPYNFRGADINIANLGLQGDLGTYSQWLEARIPTIVFQGRAYTDTEHEHRHISHLTRALLNIDRLIPGNPQNQENIYVFMHPFSTMKPIFIPELPFIIFVLGLVAILVSYILLRYRSVILNFRRFSRYLWTWPLMFFLVFFFLFLATLFIEEIVRLKDFPTLWRYAPGIFLFFKFSITTALSLIFILVVHGIRLPRTPHFYSYTAIITSFLLTLISMVMDITMVSFSLWTTVALLLFASIKSIKAKLFFLILAVIPYIIILTVVLTQPYMAVIEFLLLNRIPGNLLCTLTLLPIILGITSLIYRRTYYRSSHRKARILQATLILSLASIITLIWLTQFSPFDRGHSQPVILTEHIDLINHESWLELKSPGTIGDTELSIKGEPYLLANLSRQARVEIPMDRTPLSIESKDISFLERRTIMIELTGDASPHRIQMELRSNKPFTLHSVSMPFEMASSGQAATLFVGDTPPLPFNFQLTVSNKAELILSATATWINPEDPPVLKQPPLKSEVQRIAYAEHTL